MDGFLVVVRCQVDDLPVGLFATRREAEQFALQLTVHEIRRLATVAGFPDNAVPIKELMVQIVRFMGGLPAEYRQLWGGISFATDAKTAADLVRPKVAETLAEINSESNIEALLLAVADAVHDSSAEVGEDASTEADAIRKLAKMIGQGPVLN